MSTETLTVRVDQGAVGLAVTGVGELRMDAATASWLALQLLSASHQATGAVRFEWVPEYVRMLSRTPVDAPEARPAPEPVAVPAVGCQPAATPPVAVGADCGGRTR